MKIQETWFGLFFFSFCNDFLLVLVWIVYLWMFFFVLVIVTDDGWQYVTNFMLFRFVFVLCSFLRTRKKWHKKLKFKSVSFIEMLLVIFFSKKNSLLLWSFFCFAMHSLFYSFSRSFGSISLNFMFKLKILFQYFPLERM